MIHLILCGGIGERLWPVSTPDRPKPFCRLPDGASMFQRTVARNRPAADRLLVAANEKHSPLVMKDLEEIGCANAEVMWESAARNTAAAVALACRAVHPDELVLVTPSDHLLEPESLYQAAIIQAIPLAERNAIVTFGVRPTSPNEGYGYIRSEGADVAAFCEKPPLEKAADWLRDGSSFWNSGIYLFKAGVLLEELQTHAPRIREACEQVYLNRVRLTENQIYFPGMYDIPEESIDRAVMERSGRLKMVILEARWSDLGSFETLAALLPLNKEGNTDRPGLLYVDSSNNVVMAEKKLVALIDVDDLMIIETDEALLVCRKGSSYKIKNGLSKG